MTTYFGLCTSTGVATGAAAGNTGTAETDWHSTTLAFTCPGSGTQVIQEISSDCKNVTNYNIRLAVYDVTGTTRIAQGTGAVAVAGTSDSWQGHTSQAMITPNPANLTGGTKYLLVVSGSGDFQTNHASTVGNGVALFNSTSLTVSGFPTSLPAGTNATLLLPVRVGVNPPAAGGLVLPMYYSDLSGIGSPGRSLKDRL